jgi:hypothetical protein
MKCLEASLKGRLDLSAPWVNLGFLEAQECVPTMWSRCNSRRSQWGCFLVLIVVWKGVERFDILPRQRIAEADRHNFPETRDWVFRVMLLRTGPMRWAEMG